MKHIGIDIGMKNCTACIMDDGKDVLEIVEYPNTLHSTCQKEWKNSGWSDRHDCPITCRKMVAENGWACWYGDL